MQSFDPNNPFAGMTDEDLQYWLQAAAVPHENRALEDQIAMAQALQQPVSGQHSTGLGAALGGMGDVFRSVAGSAQQAIARDKMGRNMNLLKDPRALALLRGGSQVQPAPVDTAATYSPEAQFGPSIAPGFVPTLPPQQEAMAMVQALRKAPRRRQPKPDDDGTFLPPNALGGF